MRTLAEQKKKTRSGGSILFGIAICLLVCYVLGTFIHLQAEIADKNAQLKAVNSQIAEQSAHNEELQTVLATNGEEEYMLNMVRELGFVFPSERVIVDVSGN